MLRISLIGKWSLGVVAAICLASTLYCGVGIQYRGTDHEASDNDDQRECATYCASNTICPIDGLFCLWGVLQRNDKQIVAVATIGLLIVTGYLAIFTARLWNTTAKLAGDAEKTGTRQATDTQKSLALSEQAANAAKLSADTAVKAAMPILFPMVVSSHKLLPPKDSPQSSWKPNLRFVLENHGKSPAIIIKIASQLHIGLEIPERPKWESPSIFLDAEIIPGETSRSEIQAGFPHVYYRTLTSDEIADARRGSDDPAYKRFYFFGYVIYDDVFGFRHIKGFGRKVFVGNSHELVIQPVRGGDAYNYYHRIDRRDNSPA